MNLTAPHQLFRLKSARVCTEYLCGARDLIICGGGGGLDFELSDVLAVFRLWNNMGSCVKYLWAQNTLLVAGNYQAAFLVSNTLQMLFLS